MWGHIHSYMQADMQTDRQTCRQTNRQTDRQTDRHAARHAARQTDRQTDMQTGRYQCTHTNTYLYTHTHTHTRTHIHVDCSTDVHNLWKWAIFRFCYLYTVLCDVCLRSHVLKVPIPSSIWLPGRRWKGNWEFGQFPVKWKRWDCVLSVAN